MYKCKDIFSVENVFPSALGQVCFVLLREWQLCAVRSYANLVGAFSAVPSFDGGSSGWRQLHGVRDRHCGIFSAVPGGRCYSCAKVQVEVELFSGFLF